ncbi:polyphenol oxidase family protein [Adlercreutzia sp. ZJ138]|uniref:polyphenol oxidase family protein n=1 Tax=Adlercreutzia sp. ZJ138 TaxID=2709405 RepID=UPI001F14E215|nr:polyphenol oxidase family protein [Adlercreutzia sp. ZJ138]
MGRMLDALPQPHLNARHFGARSLCVLTDDALFDTCGVRIAFSSRDGGVSESPYRSLNLGSHVGDNPQAVQENRAVLLEALGAADVRLIVPNQVHGTTVVVVDNPSAAAFDRATDEAQEGADAIVVAVPRTAALLCFADCVPVIVVSPSGAFVVAHAGWRGALAGVAACAVQQLVHACERQGGCTDPSRYNAYIGPHIGAECFETGDDVRARFRERYGEACLVGERNVDLDRTLAINLGEAGVSPDRIAHARVCTVCRSDEYYSYRAEGGVCGRHGAIAFKED